MPTYLDEKTEKERARRQQAKGPSMIDIIQAEAAEKEAQEEEERQRRREEKEERREESKDRTRDEIERERKEELNREQAQARAQKRLQERQQKAGGEGPVEGQPAWEREAKNWANEKMRDQVMGRGAATAGRTVAGVGEAAAPVVAGGAMVAGGGAVAGGAATGGVAVAGAGTAVGATVGIIILIFLAILAVFLLLFAVLIAICNQSGIVGTAGRGASTVASWVGWAPVDVCAHFAIPEGTPGGTAGGSCTADQLQQYSQQFNTPLVSQEAPELVNLIACVYNRVPAARGLPPPYTYDQTYPACNVTRGQPLCSVTCSHTQNSCHYGGATGSQGALALDFRTTGALGDQIIAAANACGAKQPSGARCEDASSNFAACTSAAATHVHVTAAGCDRN